MPVNLNHFGRRKIPRFLLRGCFGQAEVVRFHGGREDGALTLLSLSRRQPARSGEV